MSSKEEIQLLREELDRYRVKMDEEIISIGNFIETQIKEVDHRIDLTQSMIDFTNENRNMKFKTKERLLDCMIAVSVSVVILSAGWLTIMLIELLWNNLNA